MPPKTDSVYSVVQCHGTTQSGARCKRRTSKSPYCYYHLEKKEHVKIKPSTIPHSGNGLFTTIPRRPNQKIAYYGDHPYVNNDPNHHGEYVVQVKQNPPTFINPVKTSDSAGRYANDANGAVRAGRNNAGIGYSARHHEAFIKSLNRSIPAGQEVKASYGNSYWH